MVRYFPGRFAHFTPLYDVDSPGGSSPEPTTPPVEQSTALSQADLDRVAGQARKEGRSTAMSDLLKQLGVEKLEDAQAIVEATRKAKEAEQSEADKLKAQVAQAEQKATAAETRARTALVDATIKTGAMRLTVKDKDGKESVIRARNPETVLRLVDRKAVEVDLETGAVTGAAEALAALAASDAYLFEAENAHQQKTSGTVPETPAGGSGKALTDEKAQQAQQRVTRSYRSSF